MNAKTRFVPETTESQAAVYVGVIAVVMTAIPVCVIVVIDIMTLIVNNSRTRRRHLKARRDVQL